MGCFRMNFLYGSKKDIVCSMNEQPRILVVEDDDLTRQFVVDMITSFGYSVASAADSMEAMHLVEETPSIELVFTDIRMPGVDGIILGDMLKQHRPRLNILYTTGGSAVDRVRADAGILHGNILAKPYRSDQLRTEIARILNRE
jgi:DNA-binding NtrC family response regulator